VRPALIPGTITQVIGASGQGLTRWAHSLGHPVVGQDALAHVTFLRDTVAEEVAFGLEQRGVPAPEMSHRVARILELVALDPAADPATLSGGQTRRLAVATVAVLAPSVLVLDDPFAGLDADSARRLLSLCRALTDTAVVVLGTRPQPLPGEIFSLVDTALTPHLPVPDVPLPPHVGPPGKPVNLGEVTGRRGSSTRKWWQFRTPSAATFEVGPVEVTVRPGGVLWLRGDNGTGKTTLLRALAGLDGAPGRGDVALMLQRAADQVVESTVADFVGPRVAELDVDPDEHPLDLGATDLRLAQFLAVSGLGRPVLLIDEPDVGLDPQGRGRLHQLIAEQLRDGVAIMMTCHDTSFMAEVAGYAEVEHLTVTPRPDSGPTTRCGSPTVNP